LLDGMRHRSRRDAGSQSSNPPRFIRLAHILVRQTIGGRAMPRRTKNPVVFLALSPNALAVAFGIAPRNIYAAIAAGQLEVRSLPGTVARRVLVADAEKWFRKFWIK
jgi:hypothetical protein